MPNFSMNSAQDRYACICLWFRFACFRLGLFTSEPLTDFGIRVGLGCSNKAEIAVIDSALWDGSTGSGEDLGNGFLVELIVFGHLGSQRWQPMH